MSKRDVHSTRVYFRKFPEGDIIALFPDELWDYEGNITCYQRIGQHGAASPELITELEAASPREFSVLKRELERIGYRLEVIK